MGVSSINERPGRPAVTLAPSFGCRKIRANASDLIFFFQAEDGIRYADVTGVQTCALPIMIRRPPRSTLISGAHFIPLESRNHILLEDEPAWKDFLVQTRRFLGVKETGPELSSKEKELGVRSWLRGPKK